MTTKSGFQHCLPFLRSSDSSSIIRSRSGEAPGRHRTGLEVEAVELAKYERRVPPPRIKWVTIRGRTVREQRELRGLLA